MYELWRQSSQARSTWEVREVTLLSVCQTNRITQVPLFLSLGRALCRACRSWPCVGGAGEVSGYKQLVTICFFRRVGDLGPRYLKPFALWLCVSQLVWVELGTVNDSSPGLLIYDHWRFNTTQYRVSKTSLTYRPTPWNAVSVCLSTLIV